MAARKKTSKKTASKKTNAVAKRGETAVATPFAEEFAQAADMGNENVQQRDQAIPFLVILQPLSPQVNKRGDDYIEGAEAGMLYNTATGEVYDVEDEGLEVVPVAFQSRWVDWIPKEKGGGLVQQRPLGDVPAGAGDRDIKVVLEEDKDGEPTLESVYTHYHYLMILHDDGREPEQVAMGLASTQLAPSGKLNSALMARRIQVNGESVSPPRFSAKVTLSTQYKENDQGSWFVLHWGDMVYLDLEDEYQAQAYGMGKAFCEILQRGEVDLSGEARTRAAEADEDAGADEPERRPRGRGRARGRQQPQGDGGQDDDIPF